MYETPGTKLNGEHTNRRISCARESLLRAMLPKGLMGTGHLVIYPAKHASSCMHAGPQTIALRSHSPRCNWIIGSACAALFAIHYARPQIREFVIDRRFFPAITKILPRPLPRKCLSVLFNGWAVINWSTFIKQTRAGIYSWRKK